MPIGPANSGPESDSVGHVQFSSLYDGSKPAPVAESLKISIGFAFEEPGEFEG